MAAVDQVKIDASPADDDSFRINYFEVPEEIRGRGIGKAAYFKWEKHLPKWVKKVTLYAAESSGFWESVGFEWGDGDGEMVKYLKDRKVKSNPMKTEVAEATLSALEGVGSKMTGTDAARVIRAWLVASGYEKDQWGKYRFGDSERYEIGDRVLRRQKKSGSQWFNASSRPLIDAALNLANNAATALGRETKATGMRSERQSEQVAAKTKAEEKSKKDLLQRTVSKMIAVSRPVETLAYLRREQMPAEQLRTLNTEMLEMQAKIGDGPIPADGDFTSLSTPPLIPIYLKNMDSAWNEKIDGVEYTIQVRNRERGKAVIEIGSSGGFLTVDPFSLRVGGSMAAIDAKGDAYASGELFDDGKALGAALVLVTAKEKKKGSGSRVLKIWCKLMAGYGIKDWVAVAAGDEGMPFLEALERKGLVKFTERHGSNIVLHCT